MEDHKNSGDYECECGLPMCDDTAKKLEKLDTVHAVLAEVTGERDAALEDAAAWKAGADSGAQTLEAVEDALTESQAPEAQEAEHASHCKCWDCTIQALDAPQEDKPDV